MLRGETDDLGSYNEMRSGSTPNTELKSNYKYNSYSWSFKMFRGKGKKMNYNANAERVYGNNLTL